MISSVTPKFKTSCLVSELYVREDGSDQTTPVPALALDLEGVVHNSSRTSKYRGFTRLSDRRVPWLPIDVQIRNTRQISMLSAEDLATLSADLDLPFIRPEWLNANFLIKGLPDFSSLPRGSRLRLHNGLCLIVEDRTAPCRGSGGAVKRFYSERERLEFEFVAAAAALRGLLCTVELGGTVRVGDTFEVLVPSQWIWTCPEQANQSMNAHKGN